MRWGPARWAVALDLGGANRQPVDAGPESSRQAAGAWGPASVEDQGTLSSLESLRIS